MHNWGAITFTFCLLVFFHEFGHFLVAKLTKMNVEEFSIGMGPLLFKKHYKGTDYTLRLLPIGGFNKISGMNPTEPPKEGGFYTKLPIFRVLVLGAGSVMNFLLAFLLLFFLYFGFGAYSTTGTISSIVPNHFASKTTISPTDTIIAINGTLVDDWDNGGVQKLRTEQNPTLTVKKTSGDKYSVTIEKPSGEPIGIVLEREKERLGLSASISKATSQTLFYMTFIAKSMADIVVKPSSVQLSGPIGIVKAIDTNASQGGTQFLFFIALFSINLGIFNLMPIPLLDGGHIILTLYEVCVRRKPNPFEVEWTTKIGLSIIVVLFVVGTWQDIFRLIGD